MEERFWENPLPCKWNGVSITLPGFGRTHYNLNGMESHPTRLDVFFTIILKPFRTVMYCGMVPPEFYVIVLKKPCACDSYGLIIYLNLPCVNQFF
jgi:hypothetical protein